MNSLSQIKIIDILKSEETVSGETLAKRLKISRQALHKQIQALRKNGYVIEGKNNAGYSLSSQPDLIHAQEIGSHLNTQIFGRNIRCFEVADSTQNKAKEAIENGAADGTIIIAERQTQGRGRFARIWHSEKGGIWCSLVLKPNLKPQQVPVLSLLFSLSISHAIDQHLGISTKLKWPNDVWVWHGDKYKKVCGILTEMSAESDRVNWIVLGFGINANNLLPPSLSSQAVSLSEVTGRAVNRNQILSAILNQSEIIFQRFLKESFNTLKEEYTKKSVMIGKKVEVSEPNRKVSGICARFDDDGAMILSTPEKQIKLYSGDVTLHP